MLNLKTKFHHLLCLTLLVCGATSSAATLDKVGTSRIDIDRIELLGITIFNQPDIEKMLEVTAGDILERPKVIRTEENLQELYRMHGYEGVRIRSEFSRQKTTDLAARAQFENVLKIVVNEGSPTRIAHIRLVLDGAHDQGFRHFWKAREAELKEKIGLKPSDIFDQEKVSNAKRLIQEGMASEEFIGVRVEDVRVSTVDRPVELPAAVAARWVDLDLHVDLGDRVSFGFRGNTTLSQLQLMALIDEQRILGFGKDYVARIQSRIEEEYRSQGYAQVRLTPFTFEKPAKQERHVTYEIVEGPRVEIESVGFDGNVVFSSDQLRLQLLSRAAHTIQRGFYVAKDVEKSTDLLIEWLKSQGYLGAKLVTINRTFTQDGKKIRLIIYVYEGDQTITGRIVYTGLKAFTPEEVNHYLGVQEGTALNLFAFNEGLESLKAAYRARGYLDMKILNEGADSVVKYYKENREAEVSLEIMEVYQFKVSRIDIEGLTSTKENIVRRELVFGVDDILEGGKITESEARLRRLGIFSSVVIRPIDDPERLGYKLVKIFIHESTPGIAATGVGFRNDLGARVFGQTAYTDLFGRNHTISLKASANRRFDQNFCGHGQVLAAGTDSCFIEYQFQVGYVWPWFLLPQVTFRPTVTVSKTQFITFDANTVALAATFERPLFKHPNLLGLLTYSLERTQQFDAQDNIDNQNLTIGALIPSLVLDMRDNSLAPSKGFYSTVSFEYASPTFMSQRDPFPVSYTRFQFRSDYFVPLSRDVTWYLSFRTGIERNLSAPPANDPLNKNYAIPLIKQFALGGAGSLRGFKEQGLNVQSEAIRGTANYVNYRTQIDLPFAGPMRFGPFLDAANLLVDQYSFGILRYGAGVGFHYQSPVGPVNFDWGFNLAPKPNEDLNDFYFSIGVI